LKKVLLLLSFLICANSFAQLLSSNLEKKTLALGEVNHLVIKIDNLGSRPVTAAQKNELLPFHFEEIKDSIGSSFNSYERKIKYAVYEEGTFKIHALEFKVGEKVLKTIPYEIEVNNTDHKEDHINDNMSNKEVQLDDTDYC